MNTIEYLSKLNVDQLRFAKEEADKLIKSIENETKITIWVVENSIYNVACFLENDFKSAKERLCQEIMKDSFTSKDLYWQSHPKITPMQIFESELSRWMKLNSSVIKTSNKG